MASLRQIVQRYEPGVMSVSRFTDEGVIACIDRMIESGCLRVCRDAAVEQSALETQTSSYGGVMRSILALHAAGDLKLRGREFRIIPTGEWRQYRETGRYEIVPLAQAQEALTTMSTDPRRADVERRTLNSALGLLSDDSHSPADGKVILLRASQSRPSVVSTSDAITPSTRGRALKQKENVHWIEIELIDETGAAISGLEYTIVTPDKRKFTGVTDGNGRVRLDDIVAGQCRFSIGSGESS